MARERKQLSPMGLRFYLVISQNVTTTVCVSHNIWILFRLFPKGIQYPKGAANIADPVVTA
jgi:hypothetical protein